jgi:hypothetical protein
MPRLKGGAALLAAALLLVGLSGARADSSAGYNAAVDRFLLFGGGELWRGGGFGYGGFLWSPYGLTVDGFTLKVFSGAGRYHYQSGSAEITGNTLLFAALPGWRFKFDRFETTLYAGIDVQRHRLHPDDPYNDMRGQHVGLRVGGDAWYQPSAATMIQGAATWSTSDSYYSARGAFGWRLLDRIYLGPETQVLGDGRYRQYQVGLHATAWRTGPFEWSGAAGYAFDQDHNSGAYVRVSFTVRR